MLLASVSFGSAIDDISTNNYAVYAGTNISTGNNVSINGNTASGTSTWFAKDNSITGNVYTGTSFSTGKNVSVGGDITYGSSFWMDKDSTVGGNTLQSNINISAVELPGITAQNDSMWYKNKSSINLDPGSYGSLSVSKESTIYLSSGVYDFKSIWLDKDIEIVLDTSMGDVIINSVGSFSTGNEVTLTNNGTNGAYIITGQNLTLGNDNNFAATLISNAGVSISKNSFIDGMIYANKDVWISNEVQITGENYLAKSAIPEPATALLLLTSLPFVIKKTRNNKVAN